MPLPGKTRMPLMLPALRRERLKKKKLLFGGLFHYTVNGSMTTSNSPCPLYSHHDDVSRRKPRHMCLALWPDF